MNPLIPPPVHADETVTVVAPAGPIEATALSPGLTWLKTHHPVAEAPHLLSRDGYLAGSDDQRSTALQQALDSSEVRAVIAARGGYGTTRILDRVQWEGLRSSPKWLVGSSDFTAVLMQLWDRFRLLSIHGPMIARYDPSKKGDFESGIDLLAGRKWRPPTDLQPRSPGRSSGPLIGGNLTVLAHLCGTLSPECLAGAILFIEDVGEAPYRLDRCLIQLHRCGWLRQLGGVVLGQWTNCLPGPDSVTAEEAVLCNIQPLGIPVAANYPAAHGARNYPFVHGAEVVLRVDASRAELTPV